MLSEIIYLINIKFKLVAYLFSSHSENKLPSKKMNLNDIKKMCSQVILL